MATSSTATTTWQGTLMEGSGSTELTTSGVASFDVKWAARAEAGKGITNPEELLAAAHATCYSMALANKLAQDGHPADSLRTTATVSFQPGTGITGIALQLTGQVPGLGDDELREAAEWAKENCPVSMALASVPKTLEIV